MDLDRLRAAPAWRRWLFALKPAAWPKLLAPAALGVCLARASGVTPGPGALALAGLWTALMATAILTLNDWADEDVDRLKRTLLGARCSPKTIPDGVLPARALLAAGVAAGLGLLALGAAVGALERRVAPAALSALALAVFAAYSLPPLRLNARGGGEALEALGVGAVLPAAIAALLGPIDLRPGHGAVLAGAVLLALASAVASGLSDEVSDRAGGKRTVATLAGPAFAFQLARGLPVAAAGAWLAGCAAGLLPAWLGLGGLLLAAPVLDPRLAGAAASMALEAQGRFKRRLHRAILLGLLGAGVALALAGGGGRP
jgi:1,4-dihydroxy-2-naphthoate octaprenyltransferase/chlorophyll synthase